MTMFVEDLTDSEEDICLVELASHVSELRSVLSSSWSSYGFQSHYRALDRMPFHANRWPEPVCLPQGHHDTGLSLGEAVVVETRRTSQLKLQSLI